MPWKAISVMSLRHESITLVNEAMVSFSELCRRYEIRRKTGYKWLKRYWLEAVGGLADRSRRPHRVVLKVPLATEEKIVEIRKKHQAWGARKIRRSSNKLAFRGSQPTVRLPKFCTAAD